MGIHRFLCYNLYDKKEQIIKVCNKRLVDLISSLFFGIRIKNLLQISISVIGISGKNPYWCNSNLHTLDTWMYIVWPVILAGSK